MKKAYLIILIFIFYNCAILSNEGLSNSIYIRFKPNTKPEAIQTILQSPYFKRFSQLLPDQASITREIEKGNQIFSFDNYRLSQILKAEEPLLRTFEVVVKDTKNTIKLCNDLMKKYPEIEIAEPILQDEILEIPNDPYAPNQTMLATIKAFDTWDTIRGDTNIIIGIVDTGVLQNHEDLSGSIAPNWGEIPNNNIDDDNNGFVDDYIGCNLAYGDEKDGGNTYHPNSHGTSVAGIAGATTNNAKGIAGVGYRSRIFPIKASKISSTGVIDYGYKGILYSAIRGCKVVNCSWGKVKSPSPIDQSIIDYAIARDVVVVAAGGNVKNSQTEIYYPAGYSGVLAVGEVNQVDYVTPNTVLNETIRIMAPGVGNYITLNTPNGYESSTQGGTSFAAPVVSGVVSIVRSVYPELSPLQTIEYVRQLSDDISELNSSQPYLVPGRVNMHKLLETNPFSIPGIKPIKTIFYHSDGTPDDRFFPGDTVLVDIFAHNYLGSSRNLRFVLSAADIFDSSLELLDNETTLGEVQTYTDFKIGPFSFYIKEKNDNKTFLRVDIFGENNYRDFFLIPFIPTSYISTFENDSIIFSISDKGTLGFYQTNSEKIGSGIASKSLGNQLYKAGLMVCEDSSKIVTALFALNPDRSDFRTIKPFAKPDKNIGIIDDSLAQPLERIGVEIQQFVYVPPYGNKFFKIFFKVKNISQRTLKNLSVGYFQDWDVGTSSSDNYAYLEPEAIPKTIVPVAAAVQFVQSADSSVFVGVGVHSENSTDQPQSAVLNSDFTSAFSRDRQILSLNSGTNLQFNGKDDIALVSGMRFPGEINQDEEKMFSMMIAISNNRSELKQIFLENILLSNVRGKDIEKTFNLYPNPASEYIYIDNPNSDMFFASFQIVNNLGEIVMEQKLNSNQIDISSLLPGVYSIRIFSKEKIYFQKFVKIN
ncbi:MAG: S8 family serine peptidase [Candidatus Kapaibacteriota bacterium]